MTFIRKWWPKANVKTKYATQHKRVVDREAIDLENIHQLDFFSQFRDFVDEWHKLSGVKGGLSKETYMCVRQYCSTLPKLIRYILENKNNIHILTGRIQSDVIEKRFGWYRQSNGGVFQVLNAEKKIRIKCLVDLSNYSMAEVMKLCTGSTVENDHEVEKYSRQLLKELSQENDEKLESGDEGVVYYVSGFVSKSLMKNEKCEGCIDLMVGDRNDACSDDTDKSNEKKENESNFLEMINRGGLCKPFDITFMSCVFAWKHFKQIMNEQKSLFFTFPYPCDTFVHSLIEMMRADEDGRVIIDTACEEEHKFEQLLQKIAAKYFNCMGKNFTSEVNSKIHKERKRTKVSDNGKEKNASKRKISKLSLSSN